MNLAYPQLATGALAQFPLVKAQVRRTVVNRMMDGTTVRLADADASACKWGLHYRGLSDAEREALEEFFGDAEGPLHSFLFMDPCGNLLRWSEEPDQDAWAADGLMRAEAIEDHTIRLTNAAQTVQSLRQTVPVPGGFRYCFSAYVRSLAKVDVRMLLRSADGEIDAVHMVDERERRIYCSGSVDGDSEEITCGLEIPAGAVVEVRGLQLEAQPAPSGYKRTGSNAGIFPETRFDQESLVFRAEGMDDHATVVRLISRLRS